jgi:predicted dehydrogenase
MNQSLNRRRFLKSVPAVAAPFIVPASVLGRSGRVSPNNKIVMGFIGLGGQGTNQLIGTRWAPNGGFMGREDTHVVAVCDVNRHRREAARDRVNEIYGNKDCAAYLKFEELLARPDIDAVVIATGDRWHALLSIAAAKAGKDLYCEKPHTLTIHEAQVVAQTMKLYNRVMQVGTQQRSWYEFRFACELVRNGYIGFVKKITVNVGGPPLWYCDGPAEPVPEYLDWDRWLGPAPWRPYTSKIAPGGWMAYRDYSGGEMTNWGAHMFDIAQWAMGMDESGPVEIFPPDGKEFPVLTYRYANGTLLVRDLISINTPGVRFEGTEGWLEVSRDHFITGPEHLKKQKLRPDEIHLHKSFNHQTDFLEAVRTRRRTAAHPDIARRSITVCHLGNIAYWLNRPLKWNPTQEQFVDDPVANRWLERDKRSPWAY